MNLDFSKEELKLIAYACRELSFKRVAQAVDAGDAEDWAIANRNEAKVYYRIAQRCDEILEEAR